MTTTVNAIWNLSHLLRRTSNGVTARASQDCRVSRQPVIHRFFGSHQNNASVGFITLSSAMGGSPGDVSEEQVT